MNSILPVARMLEIDHAKLGVSCLSQLNAQKVYCGLSSKFIAPLNWRKYGKADIEAQSAAVEAEKRL